MTRFEKAFRDSHPYAKRFEEAQRVLSHYPDRVPVVVEPARLDESNPPVHKRKFLVPRDLTMQQMMYVIRRQLKMSKEESIFVYVNGSMMMQSMLISEIYERHRDDDCFLYMTYQFESVFG